MKQNKWTVFISLPITMVALVCAWLLDYNGNGFWSNVFLGIFGSGMLTFIVAAINYATERRRTLEAFWNYCHKAIRNFNRYPIDGTDSEKADAIMLMNEFDFQAFGDSYAGIDFMFGNRKARKRIYEELYMPVRNGGNKLSECAFNILRLRRYAPDNLPVLRSYIKEMDELLIVEYTEEYPHQDTTTLTITNKCNRFVDECYEKLNGFYWRIMYPLKKQEELSDAD